MSEGVAVSTGGMLWAGVITTALFLGVLGIEGARRPGYDPAYHTGSELELGPGGWIQRTTFFLMGAGMAAYAAGVNRVVDAPWAAILLAVFALASAVSGVCTPDPVRGYPPGSAEHPQPRAATLQAQVHDIAGPVMFIALFAACLALATPLGGGWAIYTLATAVAGLGLTAWTALAYQRDAANTGFVQRALLVTYYVWIIVVGIHLGSS
jgi:hypothetical protein